MDAFCFVVFKMQFMENFTPAAVGRCCHDLSTGKGPRLSHGVSMFCVAEPALQPRPFHFACCFFCCITVAYKVVYKFMSVRNRNVKMWLSDTLIVLLRAQTLVYVVSRIQPSINYSCVTCQWLWVFILGQNIQFVFFFIINKTLYNSPIISWYFHFFIN